MKKAVAVHVKRFFYSLCMVSCLLFLNVSCGIETLSYLDPPAPPDNIPSFENEDSIDSIFSFETKADSIKSSVESINPTFKFKGIDVVYKIYASPTAIKNVEEEVYKAVQKEDTATLVYEDILLKRGYVSLFIKDVNEGVTITNFDDRYVYISFSGDNGAVWVSSSKISNFTTTPADFIPRRNCDESKEGKKYFIFNSVNEENALPVSGDKDFNSTDSTDETSVFYIDLYAVSVGRDTASNVNSYSKPVFLGSCRLPVN